MNLDNYQCYFMSRRLNRANFRKLVKSAEIWNLIIPPELHVFGDFSG